MEQNELFLAANPNLSLIDTLEMQPETEVIFKARGRKGVPQKILRVHQDFCLIQPDRESIHLKDGDYIAAYKTPQSETMSRSYYLARLTEKELNTIDQLLKKNHETSLKNEKANNNPISLENLPILPSLKSTYNTIDAKSETRYNSDGKSTSGLSCIIRLNEDIKFKVNKPEGEEYFYQAYKGDYFAVVLKKQARQIRFNLIPVSKDDFPSVKMQDKKESISRKYRANKLLKLAGVFHRAHTKE